MAQDTDVQTTGEDREAVEAVPLVHPQETSHSFEYGSTYRDFLISGMPDKVARAERLYKILDERDLKKRIGQFRQCRSNAWFVRHKTTHEVRVASSRCNLRWCPLCIKTKRFIMQASIIPWVKAAQKPKFITLTLKHSKEPLPAQIDRLYKSFKLLRGRKLWKDRIKGGLWFFQVKWSAKSDSWHPHLHVICEGRYVNNRNLQSTWLDITGDSMVVDIRAVKDPKKTAEYVSRYATAPANMDDLSDAEAVEVFDAMAGRRVCGTFGTGKAIQLVPKKCPDADDWEEIGSFWAVVNFRHQDEDAKAIFRAWTRGEPCKATMNPPPPDPDLMDSHKTEKPATYVQSVFEWSSFYK